MNTVNKIAQLVLVSAVSWTTCGWADGLRNPPESMVGQGKIGGNIVYVDDASTSTRNPANLTDLTNSSAIASLTVGYGKKEFTDPLGRKSETKDNWSVLPNLFAAVPIQEGLVFGIGLTTPYGRSTTFDEDSAIRYTAPYYTLLYAVNLNPSLAYKVNESVSVAAGVDILYSELDQRQIYPWSLITGTPDGKLRGKGDGYGVGYNAAINWNITERQKVSLTYRSSVEVDYEGDSRLTGKPTPESEYSSFDTEIEFPDVVAAGYGIQVTEKVRVEANIEWIRHSLFDQVVLEAGENTKYLESNTIEADWNDNWTYGVGADWTINDQWVLRAGFLYLETPIPSETITPSISEEDQSVVSVGFGYTRGNHQIDAAYSYGIFNGREVNNNNNPAYNGDYDFEAHLIGVSYGYSL